MKRFISTLIVALLLSAANVLAKGEDDVKASFDRFVTAQNAHDVSAVRDLLLDSPNFLWITRGTPVPHSYLLTCTRCSSSPDRQRNI